MDLVHALRTLRRRWKWAAIGLLPAAYLALSTAYHVGPSGLHKKSLEYGTAQAQLLIDSPQSTLASAGADVTPLSTRANVFAQFYQTDPVKNEMGRLLHVNPNAIAVSIPTVNFAAVQITPTAGQTNAGLAQSGDALQLEVIAQPSLPLITLYAQGPNGQVAAALANAAAQALRDYVGSLKPFTPNAQQLAQAAHLGVAPPARVVVHQLGTAQGGMVDSGASRSIVLLAFVGLLILDCVLVIMIGGFVDRTREARAEAAEASEQVDIGADRPAPVPDTHGYREQDFAAALTAARD